MGEEQPTITATATVTMDPDALIRALRDEATDQVRCVIALDPNAPTIAFTFPDCGSDEFGSKSRALGAIVGATVDQVFRWTIKGNYQGDDDDDYDPSIA